MDQSLLLVSLWHLVCFGVSKMIQHTNSTRSHLNDTKSKKCAGDVTVTTFGEISSSSDSGLNIDSKYYTLYLRHRYKTKFSFTLLPSLCLNTLLPRWKPCFWPCYRVHDGFSCPAVSRLNHQSQTPKHRQPNSSAEKRTNPDNCEGGA